MLVIVSSLTAFSFADSNITFPRTVWTYFSGYMSPALQTMLDYTMTTLSPKWNYTYLTPENISKFLEPTTFPQFFSKMIKAQQADYIRIKLLATYGGWWLDTGMIVHSSTLFDTFLDEIVKRQAHMFATQTRQFPPRGFEISFMYSPLGSIYMKAFEKEIELMHKIGATAYILATYRSGQTFHPRIFRQYPEINYYMAAYVPQQVALHRRIPRSTPIILKSSGRTIYEWRQSCHDRQCLVLMAREQLKNPTYSITKFNEYVRREAWKHSGVKTSGGQVDPSGVARERGRDLPAPTILIDFFWIVFFRSLFLLAVVTTYAYDGWVYILSDHTHAEDRNKRGRFEAERES